MTGEEVTRKIRLYSRYTQWGIQGRGPGARVPPPLFLDQTEARRVGKKFFVTGPPPYLRVWMTAAPASQYIHHCYWIAFRAHMNENLPRDYFGSFLLVMCRWPLRTPTPL